MKSWTKVKLGQIGVCSNIAKIHSLNLKEARSGHYWPQLDQFAYCSKSVTWPLGSHKLIIIGPNSYEK